MFLTVAEAERASFITPPTTTTKHACGLFSLFLLFWFLYHMFYYGMLPTETRQSIINLSVLSTPTFNKPLYFVLRTWHFFQISTRKVTVSLFSERGLSNMSTHKNADQPQNSPYLSFLLLNLLSPGMPAGFERQDSGFVFYFHSDQFL